ncbi:uncharacterized protein LOC119769285 [Culex quinquefasciatus]|uniref:uncharacterized protein LOC119769285 n=1 Tax=Culex quinquefasciatus TaxID=7176 RepID=UPI0018E2E69E|nr:uncharacterized protein LOC119769285 [Culex quinquefasciatus]
MTPPSQPPKMTPFGAHSSDFPPASDLSSPWMIFELNLLHATFSSGHSAPRRTTLSSCSTVFNEKRTLDTTLSTFLPSALHLHLSYTARKICTSVQMESSWPKKKKNAYLVGSPERVLGRDEGSIANGDKNNTKGRAVQRTPSHTCDAAMLSFSQSGPRHIHAGIEKIFGK